MIGRHLSSGVVCRSFRCDIPAGRCTSAAGLAAAPASLLALELTRENCSEVLALVSDMRREFPLARVLVLADRGMEAFEWLLREAGAVHFTTSPRMLDGLAHLVRSHFSRIPEPPAEFATRLWDSLPWRDVATA